MINMSVEEVYKSISLKNIKRAKLRQREAELEIANKYPRDDERVLFLEKEIEQLKKEI